MVILVKSGPVLISLLPDGYGYFLTSGACLTWCYFQLFSLFYLLFILQEEEAHIPLVSFLFKLGYRELPVADLSRGGARGARPPPPLFLDQTEAQGVGKSFLEDPPSYLRVWMTALPPPPPLYLKVWIRTDY